MAVVVDVEKVNSTKGALEADCGNVRVVDVEAVPRVRGQVRPYKDN